MEQGMTDLNAMSLDELKKLKKDVDKAIETFREREKIAALAEVEALAREKGFSLPELLKTSGRKPRTVNAPKYVNPDNPEQTWSGRGRRPKWVHDHVRCGRAMEELVPAQYQPTDLQGED